MKLLSKRASNMFQTIAQQIVQHPIKSAADSGVYTAGGAGALGMIPGTWGEWAAAVAVIYGILQITVLVHDQYKKYKARKS